MRAKDLLKELKPEEREKARKFLTRQPPHPAEIEKPIETIRLSTRPSSNYDWIILERTTRIEEDESHVAQEYTAIGEIIINPNNQEIINTLLGSWNDYQLIQELENEIKSQPQILFLEIEE